MGGQGNEFPGAGECNVLYYLASRDDIDSEVVAAEQFPVHNLQGPDLTGNVSHPCSCL